MALYKQVKGQPVKLKASEVKEYIKKVNNWTESEYNKKYDIFKNKLRAYENFERASGKNVVKQSPVELLFKEAKVKKRLGDEYQPSQKMKTIQSFTSVSSGKAGQKALLGKRYIQRRQEQYKKAVYERFKGLINSNEGAKKLYDAIQDPVKLEQALSDYANRVKAKINEQGQYEEDSAIPSGERYGSDTEVDFDISLYL